MMEEWLTTYEAARLANLDPGSIRKLVRAEKIKGLGPELFAEMRAVLSQASHN